MPSLFVFRGPDQGMRFELEHDLLALGRDAASAVHLHDSEVSRQHAEIRRQGGGFVLTDAGSSNGTFVNGVRVERHLLTSGDHIQLGGTVLLYTQSEEDSADDLAQVVDIIPRQQPGERSRIVRSMSEAEGNRMFEGGGLGAESSWLARARGNLQVMYRTALAVSHTLDIDQLLSRILQLVFEWVEADRGCIMLLDPETRRLEPKARRRRRGRESDEKLTISKTILDYVIERNEGVLTTDAREDERWNPAASIVQHGVCEAICVPMRGRYGVVGVMYIDTSSPPRQIVRQARGGKFHEEHLKLLIAIAHQAALAIEDTRYYSAMVQSERLAAMGQTIATLSHHIKNILQGIRGGSYLIKEGLAQHDEQMVGKGWEFVEKNQERISNLVLDMLTFSKERQPELRTADLNQTIEEVVELVRARAAEKQVGVVWRPAPDLPASAFDAEAIHRAILNLLTNAVDACDESEGPRRVEVTTQFVADANRLQVVVSDTGGGIEPADLAKLFTPFISTKGSRGTGLGLTVSQKIVQEHGGRIRVESTPGQGSRFTVDLPLVALESAGDTLAGGESPLGVEA